MTDAPRPPFCLSRQHPELAARSPAPRGPIDDRKIPDPPPAPSVPEDPPASICEPFNH
jgi:hypothetical protein